MAVTRLGLYGFSAKPYGSFAGKVLAPVVVVPPAVASTGGGGGSSAEHWRTTWKRRKKFDEAIEATLQEAFAPAGIVDLPKEEVRWIKPDAGEFLKKLKGRPFVEEDEDEEGLLMLM